MEKTKTMTDKEVEDLLEKSSIKNVMKRMEQNSKRLSEMVYIEDNYIIIRMFPECGKDSPEYDIELSRCETFEAILQWVHHIIVKNWVTTEMIERFISMACQYHKINLYQHSY